MRDTIILDVATSAITDAGSFMEPVSAPSSWKDAEKIAAYVQEKTAERIESAGLDIDLARVTAIGLHRGGSIAIELCRNEDEERLALNWLALQIEDAKLITYNGFGFDLPLLMRRARYLGVRFPWINLDRFKSPHVDLMEVLTDRNPQRRRPLSFYVRRLGWTDLEKPLTGEQEARVMETGQWDELAASVRHDVTATYRLACWLGVIKGQEAA